MRIPFDIKYRPEIESGKYKVVTEFGEPVRIICWDSKYHSDLPVIALIDDGDGEDMIHLSTNGKREIDKRRGWTQLWILTDEPGELTEFEKAVKAIFLTVPHQTPTMNSYVKEKSSELLTLAKETLEKEGWVGDLRKYHYRKGYEDAMRVYGEIFTYNYPPPIPTCVITNKCTNPQHDCINCPQHAPVGINKTDTKIE